MNRRGFLYLGAASALAACSRGDGTPVLKVGSQRGGTKAIMSASNALKDAPYQVEWSEFAAAQPLLEAIGSGAVDLGLVGDAPFMFAYQSGSPIKAVGAQFADQRPTQALAVVVRGNSPFRTIQDLKGKRIATTRGSVGHYLVIRALAAANLSADFVRLTWLQPGDAKAAFSSGAIDGWAIWSPYLAAALREGGRIVVEGHDLVRGYGFDVANERSIEAKQSQIADFLAREGRALEWAHRNVDAYARVLAQETGLPAQIARDYADKNRRVAVPIDATVIADQQRVLDDFRNAGEVAGKRELNAGFHPLGAGAKVATTT